MDVIHLSWTDPELPLQLDRRVGNRPVVFFGPSAWSWRLAERLAGLRATRNSTAIVGEHDVEGVRALLEAGMLVILLSVSAATASQVLHAMQGRPYAVIIRVPRLLLSYPHEEVLPSDLHPATGREQRLSGIAVVDLPIRHETFGELDAGARLTARNELQRMIGGTPGADAVEQALLVELQGRRLAIGRGRPGFGRPQLGSRSSPSGSEPASSSRDLQTQPNQGVSVRRNRREREASRRAPTPSVVGRSCRHRRARAGPAEEAVRANAIAIVESYEAARATRDRARAPRESKREGDRPDAR